MNVTKTYNSVLNNYKRSWRSDNEDTDCDETTLHSAMVSLVGHVGVLNKILRTCQLIIYYTVDDNLTQLMHERTPLGFSIDQTYPDTEQAIMVQGNDYKAGVATALTDLGFWILWQFLNNHQEHHDHLKRIMCEVKGMQMLYGNLDVSIAATTQWGVYN